MRHLIKVNGPFDVVVETTPSAVRLTLEFHDEEDDINDANVAVLLSPVETARLAVALQAAAWHHIGAKSGDETRGPS